MVEARERTASMIISSAAPPLILSGVKRWESDTRKQVRGLPALKGMLQK